MLIKSISLTKYSTYRDLHVQFFFLQALLSKSFRFLSVRRDHAKCCTSLSIFISNISPNWISLDLPCGSDRGSPPQTSGAGTRAHCIPQPTNGGGEEMKPPNPRKLPPRPSITAPMELPIPAPSPKISPSPSTTPSPIPTINNPIKPNTDDEQ